ncbi:MAG: EamA family transporter [Rhodobacteraceae bacterium]|nr:EamA family transporter [Paracoccaceae bacterium]
MNDASDNLRGALLMMLAMAVYVINDALMKLASVDVSLAQGVFVRGLVASALMVVFAHYKGHLFYPVNRAEIKTISLRAGAEITATFCYLTALFNMPLASSTAILQALPLAVTLAGALFLGEKVGWRRYLAISIGFAGVLIIIRPGGDDFNAYSLWAVAAVGFITLRDMLAAKLNKRIPSIFVALFTAVGVTIAAGVVAAFQPWQPLSAGSYTLLASAAAFILVGYITSVSAMRYGEIAFVAPFRYTILVWALLLGVFVFKDYPDFWTMVGTGIVVGTGVFTFYREQRAKAG